MRNSVVVGFFEELARVDDVMDDLQRNGFARDDISVIAHDWREAPDLGPVESVGAEGKTGKGAAIGGIAGFTLGVIAFSIPVVGPVLAAGPIAGALGGAALGAAAGGLVGALKETGISRDDAELYAEGIRRGGVVVSVATDDLRVNEAADILERHGAVDIEAQAAEWQAEPERRVRTAGGADAALPSRGEGMSLKERQQQRERRKVRSYLNVR